MESNRFSLFIFLGGSGLILFFNLWGRTLENHDYLRYAEVAKEMIRSGDWIIPRFNSEIFLHKPPLLFWLIALPSKIYGSVTPFLARLPSASFAWIGGIVVYLWSRKIWGDDRCSLISSGILISSYLYFWQGRIARTDMVFSVLILLSFYLFYLRYRADKNYLLTILSFLFMGMAGLTKGPVGAIFPLLIIFLFLLKQKKLRLLVQKDFLFLFIWFIFVFFFFTLSKGKKDNYILPLYPAAALMVGRIWDLRLLPGEGGKGFLPELLILVSLSSVAFVLFLIGVPQKLFPDLIAYQSLGFSILSCLLVGFLFSLIFFVKKNRWVSFVSLVITFTVFHLQISYSFPSKLNAQRSMKAFSEKTLKRIGMEDELKTCFFQSTGLLYYTKKRFIERIINRDRFFEVLHSPKRVFIVIQKGDIEQLKKGS
jgi:4-amino-4-deoxy-L-arabinose transferase-like glycosyltransferase